MPRTNSQLPDFTEADLDCSCGPAPQKSTPPYPPTEDIIVALEAISASAALSSTSTTISSSSLQDLSLIPDEHQHELAAAQLFQNAGRPGRVSWPVNQSSQPLPPSEDEQYQLLPASDPSHKHLWPDLSPVSVVSPMPVFSSPSPDLLLEKPAKIIRKSKGKKASPPMPSRFCHICARTQKSIKINCANLNRSRKCRKAVCQPCFEELKWDFESARQGGSWLCPHCRGICASVPRARCHIYTKTNEKRKADRTLFR